MTKRYPAGSEWRKWDLHVHVPGTKLSNGYDTNENGQPDFERFADIIEQSDVAVFGITDYFSIDQTLKFIDHYKEKYPNSEKLLLVNIELRLNETVNKEQQIIDYHVIFNDSISRQKMQEFVNNLKTEITDCNGRPKSCSELSKSADDFNRATVTRPSIEKAFTDTFGKYAEPTDRLIYLAPANNNGLHPAPGSKRKANLADEVDKTVNAIFGKNKATSEYFLRKNRYEDTEQESKPKPVFGGCDAHNFRDLENWLGKPFSDDRNKQVITWVKADPTFEGLQQTLVEPADRVSIEELRPDAKDSYKVISEVEFTDSSDFPESIAFNQNLNAIIGSRSSGKSALLAHIAYSVDPSYTVSQQCTANSVHENETGPAAGHRWGEDSTTCTVKWFDGSKNDGHVIYIPQNWLYQISGNPKEVTDKIRPVLESRDSAYCREEQRLLQLIQLANEAISEAAENWFNLAQTLDTLEKSIKQVGDESSITIERNKIHAQLESLREASSLSTDDLATYQKLVNNLSKKRKRIEDIEIETGQLKHYVQKIESAPFYVPADTISAKISLTPNLQELPESLASTLTGIVNASSADLVSKVGSELIKYWRALASETQQLTSEISEVEDDNKRLIQRHKANAALDELVKRERQQQDALDRITELKQNRDKTIGEQKTLIAQIVAQSATRNQSIESIRGAFSNSNLTLDQLSFDIEIDFDQKVVSGLSEPFRKNESGTFLKSNDQHNLVVDIENAQQSPADFLQDLYSKKQKLNQGKDPLDVACHILTATPEIRFTAVLDGDKIGGFTRSTMTPGKQALFALTLILGESDEKWPLLIDQPEDDLDSRSIYNDIVRFLVKQKKLRQIILVTHNANLVVGADAEEVLVANRHGADRVNQDERTFDYLTGSLEYSKPQSTAQCELDRQGIREFSVEILDGGEEAFEKRRAKYKL